MYREKVLAEDVAADKGGLVRPNTARITPMPTKSGGLISGVGFVVGVLKLSGPDLLINV